MPTYDVNAQVSAFLVADSEQEARDMAYGFPLEEFDVVDVSVEEIKRNV